MAEIESGGKAKASMEVKKGDIYYADLRPVIGSEQGGIRPVLIIQNNRGNRFSPTVLVAAITSRIGKADIPTHVFLEKEWKGIRKDSVVMLEQLRTLDRSRLKTYIGCLEPETMQEVNRAIVTSLGLEAYIKTYQEELAVMEKEEKRHAWLYCAVDTPQEERTVMKKRCRELELYAQKMGFLLVGHSSDFGGQPLWNRIGFLQFLKCAQAGGPKVLLTFSRDSVSRSETDLKKLWNVSKRLGLEIYSPEEGRWEMPEGSEICQ